MLKYNTLTPIVIVGTDDKLYVLHVECNPPDKFPVLGSFVTKICYHPSQAINTARQPLNLTAPFLPQTPLSNSIAVRTSIVSTAVGNRSTELVAPRDAFLKNRCVPVQQSVSRWAPVVQSLFQRRVVYRIIRSRCWLQYLLSTLSLLVKVLVCSVAWSEMFGKRKIVGRVLIDIDLDSAVFEVHVHEVGILKTG